MILSLILSLTAACRHRLHSAKASASLSQDLVRQAQPLLTSASTGHVPVQRKVSFRGCGCVSSPGARQGIERTVVRSYSIDKLRPWCSTCNPRGDTPYPYLAGGRVRDSH